MNESAKKIIEQTNDMFKTHGWYTHYVANKHPDTSDINELVNIHTHGLPETFTHPNLQIVIPITMELSQIIFSSLIDDIKEGTVLVEDKLYLDIIEGFSIKFKRVTDPHGEELMRVIFPDMDNKFPEDDGCTPLMKQQYDEVTL